MMAELSGLQVEKVKDLFCNETGYQTPKIDTRAAIFKEGKILLVHENNGTWSLPGGWCDVNVSVTENTIKEVKEEAGISKVYPVSEEIFSLESLTVDGHVKKGKYVSSHLHLNVTYLLEADPKENVSVKADENSGVAWFSPEEALGKSTEPWFVEHVYKKLINKVKMDTM